MSPTARISAASFRATHAKAATPSRARTVAPAAERTYGGRVYHSKAEAVFAARLDTWKLAGIVESWQPGVKVSLDAYCLEWPEAMNASRSPVCTYIVDFLVTCTGGARFFFEVKHPLRRARPKKEGQLGRIIVLDPEAELKMRFFRAQYRERRLVVISLVRRSWVCRYDTSLEDLAALAQAGLVLE